ncbi:MAG TPA: isoprenylcysteine carboxylmethyltransferase family protein [Terriglobales bacterium]|nr:isoprenylcysteine carboxylmethyltransferase family protein [Terriglobales bacterium]
MAFLRTLGWLIAIVYSTIPSYWLLVHPLVGIWRARRARLSRVGPLWMLLWLLVAAVTWPWRHIILYDLLWPWIPAGALFVTGVYLYVRGHHDFTHDQVLGRSELEPDRHEQRLVAGGIRARIRHPYYVGHFCELLGWSLGTGLLVNYCLLAFAVVTGLIMVRAEERELLARFGDSYRQYLRQVPAFFPKLSAVSSQPSARPR